MVASDHRDHPGMAREGRPANGALVTGSYDGYDTPRSRIAQSFMQLQPTFGRSSGHADTQVHHARASHDDVNDGSSQFSGGGAGHILVSLYGLRENRMYEQRATGANRER